MERNNGPKEIFLKIYFQEILKVMNGIYVSVIVPKCFQQNRSTSVFLEYLQFNLTCAKQHARHRKP